MLLLLMTSFLLLLVLMLVRVHGADPARLLPDMRTFELFEQQKGSGRPSTWYTEYQRTLDPRKAPFQTILQFAEPVHAQDRAYLSATVPVEAGPKCLMVYLRRPRHTRANEEVPDIEFLITANDVSLGMPLKDIRNLRPVRLDSIHPDNGKVHVTFQLNAREDDVAWPHVRSRVQISYLYFWNCE